jgi:hypothetical protein
MQRNAKAIRRGIVMQSLRANAQHHYAIKKGFCDLGVLPPMQKFHSCLSIQ